MNAQLIKRMEELVEKGVSLVLSWSDGSGVYFKTVSDLLAFCDRNAYGFYSVSESGVVGGCNA